MHVYRTLLSPHIDTSQVYVNASISFQKKNKVEDEEEKNGQCRQILMHTLHVCCVYKQNIQSTHFHTYLTRSNSFFGRAHT